MSKDDFYSFNIKKKEKGVFYVLILASLVVMVILYPMWPYPIKLGIFYVLFGLLVVLVGINIVRFVLGIFFWVLGMNFWIFPWLYDDSAGIISTFFPLYTFSCWKDDGFGMLIFWAMIGIVFVVCAAHYIQVFSFDELADIYNDTFYWTKDKIVGNNTNALTIKGGHGKYGSIEDIIWMTEEQEAKEWRFAEEEWLAKEEEERLKKENKDL